MQLLQLNRLLQIFFLYDGHDLPCWRRVGLRRILHVQVEHGLFGGVLAESRLKLLGLGAFSVLFTAVRVQLADVEHVLDTFQLLQLDVLPLGERLFV